MNFAVLLCLFLAYVQAASEVKELKVAIPECVKEHNLDLNKTQQILKQIDLPENDPEFTKFFICYHIKSGLFKPNGEPNEDKLKNELPQLIRLQYGDSVDVQKFSEEAGKHCKDTPKADSVAVTVMRLRGCVLKYVEEHKN